MQMYVVWKRSLIFTNVVCIFPQNISKQTILASTTQITVVSRVSARRLFIENKAQRAIREMF